MQSKPYVFIGSHQSHEVTLLLISILKGTADQQIIPITYRAEVIKISEKAIFTASGRTGKYVPNAP